LGWICFQGKHLRLLGYPSERRTLPKSLLVMMNPSSSNYPRVGKTINTANTKSRIPDIDSIFSLQKGKLFQILSKTLIAGVSY
jgi:hypothetical protein